MSKAFMVFGMLGFWSFIAVIIFTLIIVVELNKNSKLRKTAQVEQLQSDSMSARDTKTVKLMAMIATVLIVCYTPSAIVSMATYCVPDYSATGVCERLFHGLVFCCYF